MLLWLLLACVDPEAPMDASDTTEIVFEVKPGATAKGLGKALVDQGLVESEFSWKMYLRQADGSCLKAGRFAVRRSMGMREILETLCGVPLSDNVPFTVVEGWRIRDIDAALAARGWIAAGDYAKIAETKAVTLPFEVPSPTLEGYLYPETYMVDPPPRFSAEKLVERQLQTFRERFLATRGAEVEAGRGLHAVVVMASLLEREEPTPAQRPIVAGILWKRLDAGWQLGVDATSRYGLEDWNDRGAFLVKLRDPGDPYNTRIHKGLPPTAIGNPAIASLEAAIAPLKSDFWYYLHDGNRVFHGARNADEHEANRRRYDVW